MNHQFFLLLTYLLNFHLASGADLSKQATVHYFSSVVFVETPLSYLEGSIPLSKEVAITRNHYRFTYDKQGKLRSVAFFNGHTPREPNHTANLFTLAHRVQFDYKENTEIVSFFNTDGRQTAVLGGCYAFIYNLNSLGFRESLFFRGKGGKQLENSWNIYSYQWIYESDGTVIENRYNEANKEVSIRPGFEFYRLKLHFNSLGHIALMQYIDQEGNLVENASGAAQDQIKTNAAGNFMEWRVLDKHGNLERGNGPDIAIGKQFFNEYGYEVGLENLDENQQRVFNNYGICSSKTGYDQWGNISERRFYNESGAPAPHKKAGYFHLKLHWDTSGNYREKLEYFDVQGKPVAHLERGYHQVKYQYDKAKHLVQVSYRDINGKLINRKDNGMAYIRYERDRQGTLLKTLRYTVDHERIADEK